MAKGIRSKIMKKHRAVMRKTVGEAQVQKNLRKAVRRLGKSVANQELAAAGAGESLPKSLAGVKAALTGIPTESAADVIIDVPGLKPIEGPPRTKQLRYSFNAKLREARLDADLEDLTDDEDDVRLADKKYMEGDLVFAPPGYEESMGLEDTVELSGVRKAADKPVPKRENSTKYADNFRDGCPGMYDTDPALVNPKRLSTHRKGKYKQEKEKFRFWE